MDLAALQANECLSGLCYDFSEHSEPESTLEIQHMGASVRRFQGDQIGPIFATSAIVYFGQFIILNNKSGLVFGYLFPQ
jgi:hypothetical protein